jgi:hypothetical protein
MPFLTATAVLPFVPGKRSVQSDKSDNLDSVILVYTQVHRCFDVSHGTAHTRSQAANSTDTAFAKQ